MHFTPKDQNYKVLLIWSKRITINIGLGDVDVDIWFG